MKPTTPKIENFNSDIYLEYAGKNKLPLTKPSSADEKDDEKRLNENHYEAAMIVVLQLEAVLRSTA